MPKRHGNIFLSMCAAPAFPENPSSRDILRNITTLRFVAVCLLFVFGTISADAGTWTPLTHAAPATIGTMLLLSDGTVIAENSGTSATWYQLSPDSHGSYANGTWATLASMHDTRLYYSSQILTNGQLFVAGGEYGTGGATAEVYDPLGNTWTLTASSGQSFIDSVSKMLPDGRVLVAPVHPSPSGGTEIYNSVSNTWTNGPKLFRGSYQDEASWVKLPDDSILTIDPFGTNSERYIPSLNKWVNDANVPVRLYDSFGSELGAGFLLPNGRAFFLGATGHTVTYTPTGTTNVGIWLAGPDIPNSQATPDAAAAMMANGNILCAVSPLPTSTNHFPSPTSFYEYNYVSNSFTQVNAPTGVTESNPSYYTTMLDLPDGNVLFSHFSTQLYLYKPGGTPLAAGKPAISNLTQNIDGSYHLDGTQLNGISQGAAYGDDAQMDSNYPLVQLTDANGLVFYARTFNWTSTGVMTSTNLVSTEFNLPGGLLAGTNSLVVIANGISSDPIMLATPATPLPAVKGLAFTTKTSTSLAFRWNDIGAYENGYRVEHSTDGTNFGPLATFAPTASSCTNSPITPLTQNYYRVIATNALGNGVVGQALFAATPASSALPAPWQSQDIGAVGGGGAVGLAAGTFTIIASGSAVTGNNDAFRFVYQPVTGDAMITARVTANQPASSNAVAGVMIRDGLTSKADNAFISFGGGSSNTVFHSRTAAGAATSVVNGPGGIGLPCWVRIVRSGDSFAGYRSADGVTWTRQSASVISMPPVVDIGLAASSGTNALLNTSSIDSVLVSPAPGIVGFSRNGANLVLNGTNGFAGYSLRVMSTTNLALPVNQWTAVSTNVLTAGGGFVVIVTNAVNSASPPKFFALEAR